MQSIIDITKVVGTVQISGQTHEVCAEADATFNRTKNELSVQLRSYLHSEEQTHLMETIVPDWLPGAATITEHVESAEASAVAKDIFTSWCHKVEAAVQQHSEA